MWGSGVCVVLSEYMRASYHPYGDLMGSDRMQCFIETAGHSINTSTSVSSIIPVPQHEKKADALISKRGHANYA